MENSEYDIWDFIEADMVMQRITYKQYNELNSYIGLENGEELARELLERYLKDGE